MGRSRSYSKSCSRQSQSLLKENGTATQDYIVKSIKVAEIELMKGHRIIESQKVHKVLQVQVEIPVEIIGHDHQDFVGKQVDCMSNAAIATKRVT